MTRSVVDSSTEIRREADGVFSADGSAAMVNFTSAFGGWGLALLLSAIRQEAPDAPHLAGVNATFAKAINAETFSIKADVLRTGRRAAFWRGQLSDAAKDALLVTSDFVFADLKEPDIASSRPFPSVKAFEDSSILPNTPGPIWLKDFEQRIGLGQPFSAQEKPHSAFWFRDPGGRPWDEKSILLVSDTPMPRTFFVDPVPRFGATVQYSLHMFTTAAELAALGNEPLLIEADSDALGRGRFTQSTYIWSSEKKLLAVSNQIAFY